MLSAGSQRAEAYVRSGMTTNSKNDKFEESKLSSARN